MGRMWRQIAPHASCRELKVSAPAMPQLKTSPARTKGNHPDLAEDLFRGLALEQRLELLAVDRFVPSSSSSEIVVSCSRCSREDVLGLLVRALDDAADLVVDLARDLVGVVRLGGELSAEERLAVIVAEHARTELLAHAEPHDHLLAPIAVTCSKSFSAPVVISRTRSSRRRGRPAAPPSVVSSARVVRNLSSAGSEIV